MYLIQDTISCKCVNTRAAGTISSKKIMYLPDDVNPPTA